MYLNKGYQVLTIEIKLQASVFKLLVLPYKLGLSSAAIEIYCHERAVRTVKPLDQSFLPNCTHPTCWLYILPFHSKRASQPVHTSLLDIHTTHAQKITLIARSYSITRRGQPVASDQTIYQLRSHARNHDIPETTPHLSSSKTLHPMNHSLQEMRCYQHTSPII